MNFEWFKRFSNNYGFLKTSKKFRFVILNEKYLQFRMKHKKDLFFILLYSSLIKKFKTSSVIRKYQRYKELNFMKKKILFWNLFIVHKTFNIQIEGFHENIFKFNEIFLCAWLKCHFNLKLNKFNNFLQSPDFIIIHSANQK